MSESTSVGYHHPYATLYWQHRPTNGSWQDASNLSGYAGGQGTKTLTLDSAVESESGHLKCTLTNPAGDSIDTDLAALSGEGEFKFTVHPKSLSLEVAGLSFTTHPSNLVLEETPAGPAEYLKDFATDKTIGAWIFARTSEATAPDESGVIQTYASGQPAWYRDQGLQLEDSSTNEALYSTDWSNAAWAKTGITPSGTQLTATAGNATILQTITGASTERANAFDIRRVSGSGTVEITGDGGSTWTQAAITGTSQRFSVQATQTNPVVGIRIVTSGDVIDASWVNAEASSFPTSRIATVASPVTRSATSCTATFAELGDPLPAGGVTNDFCVQLRCTFQADLEDMGSNRFISIEANAQNRVFIRGHNASNIYFHIEKDDVIYGRTVYTDVITAGSVVDFRFRCSSVLPTTIWVNGNKIEHTTDSQADWSNPLLDVGLGSNAGGGANKLPIVVEKVRLVPEALTDEEIEEWT